MSSLPLTFIILALIIVAYFINRDVISKSKIYLLEKELEEYKKGSDIKVENNKIEKDIDAIKSHTIISKNKMLSLKENQLQNDFSQN